MKSSEKVQGVTFNMGLTGKEGKWERGDENRSLQPRNANLTHSKPTLDGDTGPEIDRHHIWTSMQEVYCNIIKEVLYITSTLWQRVQEEFIINK